MKIPNQIEAQIVYAQLKLLWADEELAALAKVAKEACNELRAMTTDRPITQPLARSFNRINLILTRVRAELSEANDALKLHRPPLTRKQP